MCHRLLLIGVGLLALFLTTANTADCTPELDKMTRGVEEPWGSMIALGLCEVYPTPVPTATPLPPTPTVPLATPTPRPTSTPVPVVGKWVYDRWIDTLTTERYELARLTAVSRTGYGDGTPTLYLRCKYGGRPEWEIFIAWDEFINDDPMPVAYRLAYGEVVQYNWHNSTSADASFLPPNRRASFMQTLADPETARYPRFIARVWRYDDQTITAQWDVAGAATAIKRLTEDCTH